MKIFYLLQEILRLTERKDKMTCELSYQGLNRTIF